MNNIDNIIKNNSVFFHNLIRELVEPLNFHPNDRWFESISTSGLGKRFKTREELEECITRPREYAYVIKHINHDFYVVSASYHKTLESLDNHILFDYRVMTNTFFNCHLKFSSVREHFVRNLARFSSSSILV